MNLKDESITDKKPTLSDGQQLLVFLFWSYFASWILWLPGILATYTSLAISPDIYGPLSLIATFSPSIVGIILAGRHYGKSGIKSLFKRAVNFKMGIWLLPAFLLVPVFGLLAHGINILFFGAGFPITDTVAQPWKIPLAFIFGLLIGGPLGEEFGWRGYAFDRMEKKWDGLTLALITGAVWTLWHIPAWFIDGAPQRNMPFVLFCISTFTVTIIITWLIKNNRQSSILAGLLCHASMNFTNEVFPLMDETIKHRVWLLADILLIIVVIIIVIIFGPKTLVKSSKNKQAQK